MLQNFNILAKKEKNESVQVNCQIDKIQHVDVDVDVT